MSDPEIVHLLQITIDVMDFQFMIGDVKDFLAFSEESIDWQHKRELWAIALRATNDEDSWERDQLEQGAAPSGGSAPHSSPAPDRCLSIQD